MTKAGFGKHPDDMGFGECMAHVRRVLFWDPVDGQWTSTDFLSREKWDRLAGYITGAHERELDALKTENEKLREQVLNLKCDLESERCYANQMDDKEKRAVAENESLRKCLQACIDNYMRENCLDCWGGPCDECDCWLANTVDELRDLGIVED